MRALQNVRAEMRENANGITHPIPANSRLPMSIVRSRAAQPPEDADDTHIEPWMELAFKGLTHASETGEAFALISCFMNGQPAALIAATEERATGTFVLPLFMAVQPGMRFTPHDDEDEGGDSD